VPHSRHLNSALHAFTVRKVVQGRSSRCLDGEFPAGAQQPELSPTATIPERTRAYLIRRFVFQWFTCHGDKPPGREWARLLGVSNTWYLKLIREFTADPSEMFEIQRAEGDPKVADLIRAREESQEMRERGELRPLTYRLRPRKRKRASGGSKRFPGVWW